LKKFFLNLNEHLNIIDEKDCLTHLIISAFFYHLLGEKHIYEHLFMVAGLACPTILI